MGIQGTFGIRLCQWRITTYCDRESVLEALGRRDPPTTRRRGLLWVDTTRIYQNKRSEKIIGVRKTRTIYKNAQGVCVWVGRESDESSSAIQLVRELDLAPQGQVRP